MMGLAGLDSTEALRGGGGEALEVAWERDVAAPALALARAFLAGEGDEGGGGGGPRVVADLWTMWTCEVCGGRKLRGEHEWNAHLKSNAHKKRAAAQRKRARQQAEGGDEHASRRRTPPKEGAGPAAA